MDSRRVFLMGHCGAARGATPAIYTDGLSVPGIEMNEEFGESCDYARPDDACTPDGVVFAGTEPNRGLPGSGVRSSGGL